MSPSDGIVKDLDEKYVDIIVKFISDVRNGKLQGSNNIALATLTLLEQIINDYQNATVIELVGAVRSVGRRVSAGVGPRGAAASNTVRRVLRAVRDEHRAMLHQGGDGASAGAGGGAGESLQRLVLATTARRATLGAAAHDLREPLRDHIAELRTEVEGVAEAISAQTRQHVHAHELVLTFGAGALVERALRAAAPRKYRLLLVEGPDHAKSQCMAVRLSGAGVPVTLVGSAAAAALMARVNKVIVGVSAALAGGAALGAAGLRAVTAAAKHYSVPVLALSPLYKLSPLHACEQHLLSPQDAPHRALVYGSGTELQHVFAPRLDYIPPDHISLFITNQGGSSPSYMYRLLSELYDPEDYVL